MDKERQLEILIRESKIFRELGTEPDKIAQQSILKIIDNLKSRNYILAVSHSNYLVSLGGTEKFLHDEQAEFVKRDVSYIQVYPYNPYDELAKKEYFNQVVGVNVDSVPVGSFTIVQLGLVLQLLNLSRQTHVSAIHIHHLMNLSIVGVKYLIHAIETQKLRFFIHDYYTICPQFNLLKNNGEFCGGPQVDSKECRDCQWGEKRVRHFSLVNNFLSSMKLQMIAPSSIAAHIWSSSFPGYANDVRIIPHQIAQKIAKNNKERLKRLGDPAYRPRVAYVGYESIIKGSETWWRITKESEFRKQYWFFHVGASSVTIPGVTDVPVSFLDDGSSAMIDTLRKHEIDIAFLWSIWPETYSFTVYEAFAANCFVVTNNLSGNIAEQIKDSGRGKIFNNEAEMFKFFHDSFTVKKAIGQNLRENSSYDLQFNPELSIEITDGLSARSQPYNEDGNLFHKKFTNWYYLLRKLEAESIQAVHIKNLEEKLKIVFDLRSQSEKQIFDLRSQLDRYYNSKPHRMLEHLRQYLDKYPSTGYILKRTFLAAWNTLLFLQGKIKKSSDRISP